MLSAAKNPHSPTGGFFAALSMTGSIKIVKIHSSCAVEYLLYDIYRAVYANDIH